MREPAFLPGKLCYTGQKESLMKSTRTVIILGIVLGLAFLFNGLWINFVFCALVLFATGMVAWTLDQYDHHHTP
jgi:4-amino-4-deoxy-L-arabinose transferase-like glycosyltransferase